MLTSLLGWKFTLPLALLASISTFALGLKLGHDWSQANELKKQQADLLLKLKKAEEALKVDAGKVQINAEELEELKAKADAVQKSIKDGSCFTPDESDSLRDLWK